MKLDFLPHDKLFVDKANMRHGRKAPHVADIVPTVRKRGVLVPLVVRPANGEGRFGIVAGARRWTANGLVLAEGIDHGPLPCAILEAGDQADAIEASLIENTARLDPDEVTQWEAFTRLVREGRKPQDISETFGLPELAVKRVLALGNLLPRIRDLYRREEIDALTVRHLTLASKSRQKAWLALRGDPDAWCPKGHQLKAWLLGGQSIRAENALFDAEASGLALVSDLFGEERCFADSEAFWTAQNAAIEARRAAYIEAGWSDAVIVPRGEYFHTWEYEKAPRRKGARVYIDVRESGEVTFHEGYLTAKEARRLAKGEPPDSAENASGKAARPELSGPLQDYLGLHRHAALRAALLGHPGVALRLMAAHAIAGSPLWCIRPEPQSARREDILESLAASPAEVQFGAARRAVLGLLGFDGEEPSVAGGNGDGHGLAGVFLRLLGLSDAEVLQVIAVVMGETLASGSVAVEAAAMATGLDMARYWQADGVFFELLHDREVLSALLADVAGEAVAAANASEKAKTLRTILRDHLEGSGGRERREGWVPKWLLVPPAAYTGRGGVGTVDAHAILLAAKAMLDDEERAEAGQEEPDSSETGEHVCGTVQSPSHRAEPGDAQDLTGASRTSTEDGDEKGDGESGEDGNAGTGDPAQPLAA
ncbi:ParB/RepB/Spo0J family partition protein [Novosphingobium malaysiense]|uniref:ParB/RepB/Spo0J family partition protein n=1 Tax=Novosphingobium malaysiense TaxID=1348853 RepID=UPI0009E01033|nr:ParB N-terminal domain-containing protein [Novosphingobium malaysiense]